MGFESAHKMKKEKPIKRKLYLLPSILTILVLVLGAFLEEGIAFFNEPFNSLMNDVEFYMIFAVNVIALLFYFIVIIRLFGFHPSPFWLTVLILLFLANTLAINHFPESVTGVTVPLHSDSFSYEYALEAHFRLRYILAFLIGCVDFYILFSIAPRVFRSARSFIWVLYAIVFVVFFSVLYSFIKEWQIYVDYFDFRKTISSELSVLSFTNNRNTFATFLLLGLVCLGVIQSESHHFWNYIMMGLLYIEMFFTVSKTGIIIGTVYILAFALYRFIVNVIHHKARAILGLLAFILVFGAFILIGELQLMDRDTVIVKLYWNFRDALSFRLSHGFLDYRIEIWNSCFDFLEKDKMFQIYGVGEINALTLLKAMWKQEDVDFYYAHNGFVHQYFSGGILRLAIYILVLVYVLIAFIFNLAKKKRAAIPYMLAILAFIGHGLTETTSFLSSESKGYILILAFVSPLLAEMDLKKAEEKKERRIAIFEAGKRKTPVALSPFRGACIASSLLLPYPLFFLGVVPFISCLDMLWFYQFHENGLIYFSIGLLIYIPLSFYACFMYGKGLKIASIILNYLFIGAMMAVNLIFMREATAVVSLILMGVSLLFQFALTIGKWNRGRIGGVFLLLLPFAFLAASFIGANHFMVYFGKAYLYLGASSFDSPTLNVAIMVGEVAYYLLLVYGLAPGKVFRYPLDNRLYRLDAAISNLAEKAEHRVDFREEIHSGDSIVKGAKRKEHYFYS